MADINNFSDALGIVSGDSEVEDFFKSLTDDVQKLDTNGNAVEDKADKDKDKGKEKTEEASKHESTKGSTQVTDEDIVSLFTGEDNQEETEESTEDPEEGEQPEEIAEKEPEESQYSLISKGLVDLGIFNEDEDTPLPSTGEEFAERFQKESEKKVVNYLNEVLSQHGEDKRKWFEAVVVNGVDPRAYSDTVGEIMDLNGLDLTDEETQEEVIREALRREGYTPDQITLRVKRTKELGADVFAEDAKVKHAQLIKKDEAELQRLETEKIQENKRKQQEQALFKSNITKLIDEKVKAKNFDGIPITEKTKTSALDYLTSYRYKLPSGELITPLEKFLQFDLKQPENYEMLAKVALLAVNNFDLSKIKQTAISTETKGLFGELAKKKTKTTINKKPSPFPW